MRVAFKNKGLARAKCAPDALARGAYKLDVSLVASFQGKISPIPK